MIAKHIGYYSADRYGFDADACDIFAHVAETMALKVIIQA
jgi:hypothetical protein